MSIKLLCQSINATQKCTSLGIFKASGAGPGPGEADFDAAGPWELSNTEVGGIDMAAIYGRLTATDTVQIVTHTGSIVGEVDTVTVGADTTVITFDVAGLTVTGTIELGDSTAVFTCV